MLTDAEILLLAFNFTADENDVVVVEYVGVLLPSIENSRCEKISSLCEPQRTSIVLLLFVLLALHPKV